MDDDIRASVEDLGGRILQSIDAEFRDGSDRAIAIVGVAYQETIVEELLRAALSGGSSKARESLLRPDGAIGSNGARFKLACALDLISSNELHDLSQLAKIRNRFAHDLSQVTFTDDNQIRDLVDSLHISIHTTRYFEEAAARQEGASRERFLNWKSDRRALFVHAVHFYIGLFLRRVNAVRHATRATWYPEDVAREFQPVSPT